MRNVRNRKGQFWTCEKCGSNLDFGESCDCTQWVELPHDTPLPFDEKPNFKDDKEYEQLVLFPVMPKKKKRK